MSEPNIDQAFKIRDNFQGITFSIRNALPIHKHRNDVGFNLSGHTTAESLLLFIYVYDIIYCRCFFGSPLSISMFSGDTNFLATQTHEHRHSIYLNVVRINKMIIL